MNLSVREITESDIKLIINYFHNASPEFLLGMGVEKENLPDKVEWANLLLKGLAKKKLDREFYFIIWQFDGYTIGHSTINKIIFGKEATMHLHIWKNENRQKGIGFNLLKQTMPYYFENFKLKKLICKPYNLNPAPNKTLKKIGFELVKEYTTTPGWLNFHQRVNKYVLTKERFEELRI